MVTLPEKDISSIYTAYLNQPVELEARFGFFTLGGFESNVGRDVYNRLRQTFAARIAPIYEKSTDYIADEPITGATAGRTNPKQRGSIRRSEIYREGADPEIKWLLKRKIQGGQFDIQPYGIRIGMSLEEKINPVDQFIPTLIRRKERYSYLGAGGAVRIDITAIDTERIGEQAGKPGQGRTTYEVEVELIDRTRLPQFRSIVETVLRSVQDTVIIYTYQQRDELMNYLNKILGGTPRGQSQTLDDRVLVQARNLNAKDMVWGGLVGNPNTMYMVSHKADGYRKLLVFAPSGIWLVAPPLDANLIYTEILNDVVGTVLDGEYVPKGIPYRIPKNNPPDAPYWFIAFDCLATSGNLQIQQQPHRERMLVCQAFANRLKDKLLYVSTKTTITLDLPDNPTATSEERVGKFFSVMKDMFAQQDQLAYKQDGFVFTPTSIQYNPHSDDQPLYERVLTRLPDICKWKPREKLTIDFQIQWNPAKTELTLLSSDRGQLVPFRGSEINIFTNEVDTQNPLTLTAPSGTIVEYRFDYERSILVPERLRTDKPKPNRLEYAIANWDWIHDPVTSATLTGQSFDLVFKYHNRVKRGLYNSVFPRRGQQQYRQQRQPEAPINILEIGAGRGGTVHYWKQANKVVAVEPNPEYIPELERRIRLHGLQDRVRIVNTVGQDTEQIVKAVNEFIGGPVDVVSMMLSMTFFWESEQTVTSLANTINGTLKENGKVIFFTLDGDTVAQMFNPVFRGFEIEKLNLGPAYLEYQKPAAGVPESPAKLYIDIPGTIVTKQTEWLVHIYDLINHLINSSLVEIHRAETEKFLSPEEYLYSQMYSFGLLQRGKADGARQQRVAPSPVPVPVASPKAPSPAPPKGVNPTVTPAVLPVTNLPIETPRVTIPQPATLPGPPIAGTLPKMPLFPGIPPLAKAPATPKQSIMVAPKQPVRMEIPWLMVRAPRQAGQPGVGDDVVQQLTAKWYQNLVRIAAIGDGSCFFHAVLKAYTQQYQNNDAYNFRVSYIQQLRRDIAYALQLPDPNMQELANIDPEYYQTVFAEHVKRRTRLGYLEGILPNDYPEILNYETASDGQFVNLFEQQQLGLVILDPHGVPVDFSLRGLQYLMNSHRDVGDEVYGYLSQLLGVTIYVMHGYYDELEPHINTAAIDPERWVIVIIGNGIHYEVVGIQTENGYQTVFPPNHPLLAALETKIQQEALQRQQEHERRKIQQLQLRP